MGDIHRDQIEQSLQSEGRPYYPPVVTNERELLIEALRAAERSGIILNMIRNEVWDVLGDRADDPKWDRLHALIRTQHNACSGLHLFIATSNMGLDLPDDLTACNDEAEPA